MIDRLKNAPLSQQLATFAAGLCLTVSLALVTLGGISSKHLQRQQQADFGNALAHQIARRISTSLETGDLLSVSASLQRFVETSSAARVAIFDVEGKALGQAGTAMGQNLFEYRAPLRIESDVAGEVVITVNTDTASAAHLRFVLSLLGLAVLLSLTVYGVGLHLGKRVGSRVTALTKAVSLEGQAPPPANNELEVLAARIDNLPMELLRTNSDPVAQDENYRTTAVLYLQLDSLMAYVDTLDEQSLHRYTDRLHQVVYASAGFYGGEIQVTRQFALAVYFSGPGNAGSAPFRAASCAWLIHAVTAEIEKHMPLSLNISIAASLSELGIGDEKDIYPGLYMQSTLDELQTVCASKPPKILLSPAVCEDTDVAGRVQQQATEVMDYTMVEGFAGPYDDLLERQLQLILKRLLNPALL
ncbi:hypothetical protein EY643_18760 [Halioglobus maricola]|uniref:Guanylate cyclase domain-containing protein n=1 Tax=Halioglobus maricola TaxID=2601894 RepID=A0A5P9NPF7_9GAMM|nr:hypothetical protein [Halioglobus maricola]QFU77549.1 hypothetical protein EY643_18760 [Halioglobus maricola]